MKIHIALIGILMICLMAGVASATSTTTPVPTSAATVSAEQALSQVYVSSVSVDPQEFYPGETGTITVQLTNTGSQDVPFEHADILDSQNVYIPDETQNPYQVLTYLGPGNTMTYTFLVVAKPPDGIYYPVFSVASTNSQSIIYPIEVQVSSTPIQEVISQEPQNFAINETDNVTLQITNPRAGQINNTMITASGPGISINPQQVFVGTISGGSAQDVPFSITPHQAGNVTFTINYYNGVMNPHSDTLVLPLNIGQGINEAVPVINDLALTTSDGAYSLSGDVTNEGIADANGVLLSVESPAQAVQPYASYAVGSLTANDFSSFTLTFTSSDLSAVPIKTQWEDDSGNTLTTVQTFDLRSLASALEAGSRSSGGFLGGSSSGTTGATGVTAGSAGGYAGARGGGLFGIGGGRGGGLSSFYPVIIGAIVLIAAIVLYVKRKWILGKFRKQ
jgi:hypothetical protein